MIKSIHISIFLILLSLAPPSHLGAMSAVESITGTRPTYEVTHSDTLPTVFKIGENEAAYEALVTECSNPLLTVCKDSMDLAYRRWMTMLSEMEVFAEKSDFDIKGIKIWLNVFWSPEGEIKHLVYFPKPNSRNMDFDLLTKFLFNFVDHYKMESLDDYCFSHYGSAAFPTFADIYLKE